MSTCCYMQDVMNTYTFMDNAFDQALYKGQFDTPSNTGRFNSAILRDVEFRTETNDFDFSEQQYRIRVSPSTRGIRSAERGLYSLYANNPKINSISVINDFIAQSYSEWIDLYILSQKSELQNSLDSVLQKKKDIAQKLVSLPTYDVKNYLDIEKDILKLKHRTDKSRLEIQRLLEDNNRSILEFDDLITVDQIREITMKIQPSDFVLPNKFESDYDKALLERELDLEYAENKQILKFAEISYSGPHDNPFQERVSVGLGLRFPHDGDNRLKIEELKIKLNEIDTKEYNAVDAIRFNSDLVKSTLLTKIAEYELEKSNRIAEQELNQKISKVISSQPNFNPIDIVELEQSVVDNKINELEILSDIYKLYLSLLERSNKMFEEPFINYLHNKLLVNLPSTK